MLCSEILYVVGMDGRDDRDGRVEDDRLRCATEQHFPGLGPPFRAHDDVPRVLFVGVSYDLFCGPSDEPDCLAAAERFLSDGP